MKYILKFLLVFILIYGIGLLIYFKVDLEYKDIAVETLNRKCQIMKERITELISELNRHRQIICDISNNLINAKNEIEAERGRIQLLQSDMKGSIEKLRTAEGFMERYKIEISKLQHECAEMQKKISELEKDRAQKSELEKELNRVKAELEAVSKEKTEAINQLAALKNEKEVLMKEMEKLKALEISNNELKMQLEQAVSNAINSEARIKEMEKKMEELIKLKDKQAETIKFLEMRIKELYNSSDKESSGG